MADSFFSPSSLIPWLATISCRSMNPSGSNQVSACSAFMSSVIATPVFMTEGSASSAVSASGRPITLSLKSHARSPSASCSRETLYLFPFLKEGLVSVSKPSSDGSLSSCIASLNFSIVSTRLTCPSKWKRGSCLSSSSVIVSLNLLLIVVSVAAASAHHQILSH